MVSIQGSSSIQLLLLCAVCLTLIDNRMATEIKCYATINSASLCSVFSGPVGIWSYMA